MSATPPKTFEQELVEKLQGTLDDRDYQHLLDVSHVTSVVDAENAHWVKMCMESLPSSTKVRPMTTEQLSESFGKKHLTDQQEKEQALAMLQDQEQEQNKQAKRTRAEKVMILNALVVKK